MSWFDKLFKKNEKGNFTGIWNIFLILAIGVILLFFSNTYITEKKQKTSNLHNNVLVTAKSTSVSYEEKLEKKLEETFSQIEGVGKVKVLLTIESSKEIIINKDTPYKESSVNEEDGNGGVRHTYDKDYESKTILKNNSDGSTEPIVLKETMPVIKGVVILAEGGENPEVEQKLTKAAMILLDVSANRIEVCKMK